MPRASVVVVLTVAGALSACASYCERDTPALAQSNDRYGGIATAQGGCQRVAPVSQARLRESLA